SAFRTLVKSCGRSTRLPTGRATTKQTERSGKFESTLPTNGTKLDHATVITRRGQPHPHSDKHKSLAAGWMTRITRMDRHYGDWQRLARISHRLVTIHSQVPLPEEEGRALGIVAQDSGEKCGRG